VVSNIGTWIQEVGAAWLMTSLAPSPLWVALVQTSASLPLFLLALPAGALADLLDRRRLLLAAQCWMLLAALTLAWLTLHGQATPLVLLACTMALGIGAAIAGPAWQASVPELVPSAELPAAVAINSLGFNIARSVGPALGGLALAFAGASAAFALNALSFLAVVWALFRWRRRPSPPDLPREDFLPALRSGLRYVGHSPSLQAVLVRGGLFVVCASALWALLPHVARFDLHLGPGGYALLVTCFGSGAVAGAANLARARRHFGAGRLALLGTVLFAATLATLAARPPFAVVAAALLLAGGAWLTVLSGLNVAAQLSLPGWVRARGLSVYLCVFYAAMVAGSTLWGALAARFGNPVALAVAGAGLLAGLFATGRFRLREGPALDLAPSRHWAAPLLAIDPEPERGPVLVTVEYRIDSARAAEFVAAMNRLRRSRRRGGAVRWALWVDAAEPGRYLESFVDASWLDYLRHQQRVTGLDREIELAARALHVGPVPPAVTHFLAAEEGGEPTAVPPLPIKERVDERQNA
jgi:MFS family permease